MSCFVKACYFYFFCRPEHALWLKHGTSRLHIIGLLTLLAIFYLSLSLFYLSPIPLASFYFKNMQGMIWPQDLCTHYSAGWRLFPPYVIPAHSLTLFGSNSASLYHWSALPYFIFLLCLYQYLAGFMFSGLLFFFFPFHDTISMRAGTLSTFYRCVP